MSTCVYCGQRKGKRTCPALGGAICSACCGAHRLIRIDCPADCVWLGGLAIVRDPARVAEGFSKHDWESALNGLIRYGGDARAFSKEAVSLMFGEDRLVDEWAVSVSGGFVCYGHRDARGLRLVDHYLADRGRDLRPGQTAALLTMKMAWASLFEVESVDRDVGMSLRDLLSGETLSVREVAATRTVQKGEILFAWLMPVQDHLELAGALCSVPWQHLDKVRAALDVELQRRQAERPGTPVRELVGELAWAPMRTLMSAMRQPFTRHSPTDVQREVAGQVLNQHYRRWLDEPLPALAGATPRQAAATQAGRPLVEALLEEIEDETIAMPGGDQVDFSSLWEELGLQNDDDDDEDEDDDDEFDPELGLRYDASQAPDAGAWLAADEAERSTAVEQHHGRLTGHPETPRPAVHAAMHVIVENQLAADDPAQVAATLARLLAGGVSRHDAIHAIGSVMFLEMNRMVGTKTKASEKALARALGKLRAEDWRTDRS